MPTSSQAVAIGALLIAALSIALAAVALFTSFEASDSSQHNTRALVQLTSANTPTPPVPPTPVPTATPPNTPTPQPTATPYHPTAPPSPTPDTLTKNEQCLVHILEIGLIIAQETTPEEPLSDQELLSSIGPDLLAQVLLNCDEIIPPDALKQFKFKTD